jgi:hypothetical protein
MSEEKPEPAGIAGLPKVWAVAVQLVGTFGLAVFLVLYYVLVLQPAEAERYEKLAASVNDMLAVLREEQSLLTRQQVGELEELYIRAAAPEVAAVLASARERGQPVPIRDLEDLLLLRVNHLEGLTRVDGGNVASQLQNKLRNSQLAERLIAAGAGDWRALPLNQATAAAMDLMRRSIVTAAMAK